MLKVGTQVFVWLLPLQNRPSETEVQAPQTPEDAMKSRE